MVKNFLAVISLLVLGSLLVLSGCNQSSPAFPKDVSSLTIKFPVPGKPAASPTGVSASSVALAYGTLAYRITSGNEVIKGAVSFNYGYQVIGNVSIPLPHNGSWLVSAEWFDYGGYYAASGYSPGTPRFIGADMVDVKGTTAFNLQLGDITLYGCSYMYLGDVNSCTSAYYPDLFTFDSGSTSYSNQGGNGDIQIGYDPTSGSEYMTAGPAPIASIASVPGVNARFAYLGNGDFVDHTNIPVDTKFYTDSLKAKTAVLGDGNGNMSAYDVYLVQLVPNKSYVWLQINYVYYCGSGGYLAFGFRENTQGYPYMKYQATTYGLANCIGLTYYPGGG